MKKKDVLGVDTKAQGDDVVTNSVGDGTNPQDNFGGDQANNTRSLSGWYIFSQNPL